MNQHENSAVCLMLPLHKPASGWLRQGLMKRGSGENVKHSGYPRPKNSLQTAVQSCHILQEVSVYGSNNFCYRPRCSPELEKCNIDGKYSLSHYLREVSLERQHSSPVLNAFTKNCQGGKREQKKMNKIGTEAEVSLLNDSKISMQTVEQKTAGSRTSKEAENSRKEITMPLPLDEDKAKNVTSPSSS